MTSQGLRLQKIRKTLNITQEVLGRTLEVSKQVISNIEADRVLLNNDKLVLLGENFNVNMNYLLLGRGEMFVNSSSNHLKSEIKQVVKEMFLSGELDKNKLL